MDELTPADPYAGLLHELRGPVTSIQSYMRMLIARDAELSPTARATIHQVILQQSQRLDGFVDDMVLYVRLLGDGVELHPTPVLLSALLEELRQRLGEPERVVVGAEADVVLQVDRDALGAILRRLIRNAFVYGPREGLVTISVGTHDGRHEIRVSDTGLGMPSAALEQAFQPFVRAVRPGERRSEGVGLGLAVAHQLATLMGGDLALVNTNPGLTAALRLPA
jgi:signal transduction histidine kinase